MKKVLSITLCCILSLTLFGCKTNNDVSSDKSLPYGFATREEAIKMYLANEKYLDNISPYDIQYKTLNKINSLEEYKEYGSSQMREFTDYEKEKLTKAMDEIETIIKEKSFHLPKIDEIIFIRSSQKEEGGATAYTHKTQIYMDGYIPSLLYTSEEGHKQVLVHEIFHCLSRNDSDFRKNMNGLINFNVLDKEIEIPESLKMTSISNPDVSLHNSYATFTINGEKKGCYMMDICLKPYESSFDKLSNNLKTVLAPLNKNENGKDFYFIEEAEDFWQIFGENTKYVIDPE